MAKKLEKTRQRDAQKAAIVQKVAEITGFSTWYVYKVIAGDRENEDVISTYMFISEGENKLVESAKKLVPFN